LIFEKYPIIANNFLINQSENDIERGWGGSGIQLIENILSLVYEKVTNK